MIKFLDLYAQYQSIKPEIDEAMADVIRRSAFIGGEGVTAFEHDFAAYQAASHCVGVGNGTDAIEIVLEALALPRGSEVIVPANSFIASSEAVTRSGFRVVFADVDRSTYTLSPEDVRRRMTARTSAILAVHLYGQSCDMDPLLAVAAERGVKVVEDCAQAHGAEYRGRRVGTLGHAGTFSFYPGKNLGAYGDGGAITTNEQELANRCRMIANHGRIDKYNHKFEGRNSRLDGLQAAILRVKLRHLERWVERRNQIAQAYVEALSGTGDLILPKLGAHGRHAFHLFVIRSRRRDALAEHLKNREIQTGIHYPIALPRLQAYAYLGQAEEAMFASESASTLLSLPMGEHLDDGKVKVVVQAVKELFGA
jgi:dTDP-4-amino-4,6-dideoxygalactose transaminase